jgi:hypothetical protein
MVVHWWHRREDAHWRRSLFFNATGGFLSAIVFITAGITKFTAGAWVAVLTIGLLVMIALRIRHHYDLVGKATALHPHIIAVPKHRVTPNEATAQRGPRATLTAKPRACPGTRTTRPRTTPRKSTT